MKSCPFIIKSKELYIFILDKNMRSIVREIESTGSIKHKYYEYNIAIILLQTRVKWPLGSTSVQQNLTVYNDISTPHRSQTIIRFHQFPASLFYPKRIFLCLGVSIIVFFSLIACGGPHKRNHYLILRPKFYHCIGVSHGPT